MSVLEGNDPNAPAVARFIVSLANAVDRSVTINYTTVDGSAKLNGAFADYLVVPQRNLHVVPDSLPTDLAVFTEPVAAAFQILEQIDVAGKPASLLLIKNPAGTNEVLRTLRASPRTATVPVVVLTSSAEGREVAQCYQAGANSFVSKPIRFADFVERVKAVKLYWVLTNLLPECQR